ncbi:MAG TPA: helix-turn-helix transcriptional regulator [Bryobacteraceae bacterium]|nr:helix-turn-helix transcriptional regulator [Bryobacteraceae bacterium]
MNASFEDLLNEVPNPPQDLKTTTRRDLDTVRRWVEWILLGVDRLNSRFLVDSDISPVQRQVVLQNAFLVYLYSWSEAAEIGKASLIETWINSSLLIDPQKEILRSIRNRWAHHLPAHKLTSDDGELLAIFNAAVAERFLAEGAAWQGRQIVRDLLVRLDVTREELASMLRVPEKAVEDWESGRATIPKNNLDQLQHAGTALTKLLSIFRPERLPQVIRRKASLFDGQRAIDWIVHGRISEVAERYESALAYQA